MSRHAQISEFPINVMWPAYGAKNNGSTDDTAALAAAFAAAVSANRPVYLPGGNGYNVTALPAMSSFLCVYGDGQRSQLNWSGTGKLFDITSIQQVKVSDLVISMTGTGAAATAFYLSNSFRCSIRSVRIQGSHSAGTPNTNQIGVEFRANAGDNRFQGCDFNNLWKGVATSAIQNYIGQCDFGSNYYHVHGDAGNSGAGCSFAQCTFLSNAQLTPVGICIDVAANAWWFTSCWFEGAQTALQIGATAVGGPFGFSWIGGKIAATFKDIDVQNAKQTTLIGINLAYDTGSTTPTAVVSSGGTTAPAAGTSEAWTSTVSGSNVISFPSVPFLVADTASSGEIMQVTAVSGTAWTVTRGYKGTVVAHTTGFTVQARPVELVIDTSHAADGFVAQLVSSQEFELLSSTFPISWTHIGRSRMKLPGNLDGHVSWASDDDAQVGLKMNLRTNQTADAMQVYNKSGALRWRIDANAGMQIGTGSSVMAVDAASGLTMFNPTGRTTIGKADRSGTQGISPGTSSVTLTVIGRATNNVAMVLATPSSMTTDMFEWQDGSGNILGRIDKAGRLVTDIATAPVLGDLFDGELALSQDALGNLVTSSRVSGVLTTRKHAGIVGRVVTAAATITDADQTIVFNSASTISQALVSAASATLFKQFQLTNINTGVVTLTDTISGTASRTLSQWASLTVYTPDNSVWVIA